MQWSLMIDAACCCCCHTHLSSNFSSRRRKSNATRIPNSRESQTPHDCDYSQLCVRAWQFVRVKGGLNVDALGGVQGAVRENIEGARGTDGGKRQRINCMNWHMPGGIVGKQRENR